MDNLKTWPERIWINPQMHVSIYAPSPICDPNVEYIRADLAQPAAWEPKFDATESLEQEELAIKFAGEIAGKRGEKPSLPDPVRLLEMAQELYLAERNDADVCAKQPAQSEVVKKSVSGQEDTTLPELPHTAYNGYADGSEPLYTREQMFDYARAATASLPQVIRCSDKDEHTAAPQKVELDPLPVVAWMIDKYDSLDKLHQTVELSPLTDDMLDDSSEAEPLCTIASAMAALKAVMASSMANNKKPGFIQQIKAAKESVQSWPSWMQDAAITATASLPQAPTEPIDKRKAFEEWFRWQSTRYIDFTRWGDGYTDVEVRAAWKGFQAGVATGRCYPQ